MHTPHNLRIHERFTWEASVPLLLVVMVEGRTEENALACACCFFGDFEPSNLHQDGASFGNDDDAHDGEE